MDVGFAALGAFGREEHHRRAGELTGDLAAIGAELLDHFVVELGHRRHGMTPRLGPKHPGLSAPLGEATSDVDTSRRITQTGIVGVKALGEPCSRLAISPIDCACLWRIADFCLGISNSPQTPYLQADRAVSVQVEERPNFDRKLGR